VVVVKPATRHDDEFRVARRSRLHRSLPRLIAFYAAVLLVPVLLLGLLLGASYRAEARQRGLAEGRSEARLVAQTAVDPALDGRPLSDGISPEEKVDLQRLVRHDVKSHDILRLRLRDLSGQVVFSDDGSGFGVKPEDEALEAARGQVVERLTPLNSDDNDRGATGPESVEIYVPLTAGDHNQRVGVLELYLPYAPINADVNAGLHTLYLYLALGLAALYLVLFAISISVSQRLRYEVRLNKFLAEHDALTNLPNRSLFHRRAERAIKRAARRKERVTLAIIDLDRFKEINDALGHQNGDQLLVELAKRLETNLRPKDTIARLGGDEFGVILTGDIHPETHLSQLRDLIELEVQVSGLPVSIESSIGFAIAPEDGLEVDELMQRADVAMYLAKSEHAGVARYDRALDNYDAANLGLIAELRRAISEDELVLHYQPKARVSDGRIDALEALVRWQHPTLGLLQPDRFIPLAEPTDLIERLTEWVLARALTDIRDLGPNMEHVAVAVNVSARSLSRPDFAERVIDTLDVLGVEHHRLIVEITETALLVDPPRAAIVLAELAAAGVSVSIDDFGVGQTSLGYLSSLPLEELKIDRSFVADITTNGAHMAIVRSIVDLGHNLGFRVVAEGVETNEVLGALGDTQCDLAQGFLIARPMALANLIAWSSDLEAASAHASGGYTHHVPAT
jgi:diguanylate cyclase (GGDEF)-like protein